LSENLLPVDTLKVFALYELHDGENYEDQLTCPGGSLNGTVLLKYVVALIKIDIIEEKDPICRIIWHVPITQRARFFIWLIVHDLLGEGPLWRIIRRVPVTQRV